MGGRFFYSLCLHLGSLQVLPVGQCCFIKLWRWGNMSPSPSLEIFKTHLDKVVCSLLRVTQLRQGGWTG